uniref:THO complex subunit 5 n=1 Tax=Panagrellus redivivus TaxID=6233 RepID=A0A7E4ZVS7_PANRE
MTSEPSTADLKQFKDAIEFYEKEEAIAANYTSDFIRESANALLADYLEALKKHDNPEVPFTKDEIYHLQAIVVKLRGLNRRSNLRTKLAVDKAEVRKKELEKKYLALQNVEVEIDHLQRAIDDLKTIESTELSLVTPEEYAVAKNIPFEEVAAMTEHKRETELLNLELELRKGYVTEIEQKRIELAAAEKALDERQRKLDNIVPTIQQVRKIMTPALQVLDLHTVTPPHLDRAARARHLPSQLSCLYVNVIVYNKINEGKPLRFTCNGSIDEVEAFEAAHKAKLDQKPLKNRNGDNSDDEDDEAEAMEVDAPDSSRAESTKNEELVDHFKSKQKLFAPHPISFMMELPRSHAHKTNLSFYYLPDLDVVVVKAALNVKATHEPFLNAETILDEIYPGDKGTFDSPIASTLLSLAGVKLSEIQLTHGRPYKFAQQLCLVGNEDENESTRGDRFRYFLRTILKIDERIKTREVLDATYNNALNAKYLDSLPEALQKHVPKREAFKLTDFTAIDTDKILDFDGFSTRQKIIVEQLQRVGQLDSGFNFVANVADSSNDSIRVHALFHVPCGYPDTEASSMVLLIPADASKEKQAFLTGLDFLELYLNTEVPKQVAASPQHMFALQLAILPSRVDVVSDISERDTTEGYAPSNFFFNFHMSRLNDPIFDFIPSRNAYGRDAV